MSIREQCLMAIYGHIPSTRFWHPDRLFQDILNVINELRDERDRSGIDDMKRRLEYLQRENEALKKFQKAKDSFDYLIGYLGSKNG